MYEYWRERLDSKQQLLYAKLCNAVSQKKPLVESNISDQSSILAVYTAVVNDHPEYYWLSPTFGMAMLGLRVQLRLSYIYSPFSLASLMKEERELTEKVRALSSLSETDIEKRVLTDLILPSEYEINVKYNQNAMSVLHFKKAQCSGFASAFKWAMDLLSIPCIRVNGELLDPKSGSYAQHSWNIICINGEYYHADPTNMLGANRVKTASPCFRFINCSDATMKSYNYRWDTAAVPRCTRELPLTSEAQAANDTRGNIPSFSRLFELYSYVFEQLSAKNTVFTIVLNIPQYSTQKLANTLMGIVSEKATELRLRLHCQITTLGNEYKVEIKYL